MSMLPEVSADAFASEVLGSAVPVLVEFSAPWCHPCKQMEPYLAQLANEWNGKARLVKVDVDQSPDLTMRYQIMTVPSLLLFKGGQETERMTGLQSKDKIVSRMSPHLG